MTTASQDPVISFEKIATLNNAREAAWFAWRRTLLKVVFVVWLVSSVAAAYVGSHVSGGPSFLFLLPIMAVASGIILAGMHWFRIARATKKQTERAQSAGPELWTIDHSGINVESRKGRLQLKWEAINGYAGTKSLILVRGAAAWLGIPIDCLSSDQKEQLLQVFEHQNIRRVT